MDAPAIAASLARIEAKLEAIDERLDSGALDLRELRRLPPVVATTAQAVKTHSKVFWAVGTGVFALLAERLKALF